MKKTFAALLLLALSVSRLVATEAAEDYALFESKVRPLLAEHCYDCHSERAKKIKGGLLLDSKAGWQKGGDSGEPALIPGKPEESLAIKALRHDDPDTAMPPKKPKLPDAAIADLIAWVKMGAPDPRTGNTIEAKRGDKSWWSLQSLTNPQVPSPKNLPDAWAQNPIDRFIFAKLAEQGLTPSPPADSRILIRRLTYDLTGLPPSPEQTDAFISAHAADPRRAIESLVDRLLASPQYGEHWGRHWLDVVRFGESNGFERNFLIDDLWPFRDYVIRSFNEDRPFNEVIVEHLAGDVLAKDNPEIEVASAFLVAGPYDDVGNQDAIAQKNIRAATLDDIITATGSAFLGLTVNCARCHNHKFDPIPTEDYYRLRSAFEGITHGRRVIASKQQREQFAAAVRPLEEQLSKLNQEKDALNGRINELAKTEAAKHLASRPKVDVHGTTEVFEPIEAQMVKFVIHAMTSEGKTPVGLSNGRLTEFEIWTEDSRNAALASNGAKAEGAKSATAEDFPEAYAAHLCIDGQLGEQWFIGQPAELLITLPRPEIINRIHFTNSKGANFDESKVRGSTPCEYEVMVSTDRINWTTVASDKGREPWSPEHAIQQARRTVITPELQAQLARLNAEVSQVQKKLNAVPKLQQVWAGNYSQPTERTFVQKGGDPTKPGAPVLPASLNVLDRVTKAYELAPDAPESERRLALGRWIVAADNPLSPRVLVNRLWHYHFGTGIVDTPSDFGFFGGKPTHPELLDWLAQRLHQNGWKLKALQREIVLSQTYQQSSVPREEAARLDKDARMLWRFPPRRLSAEELRDTILVTAGKLDLRRGGPGFRLYKFTQNNVSTYFPLDRHGPETYRRAVYHQNARASIVDLLSDFDFPDIAFAAPRRANTTTPLQALTLLNHSFTLDMASALASRVSSSDPAAIADEVYRLTLIRPPSPTERAAAIRLISIHGAPAFCRAMLNLNELIYLQ